MGLRIKALCKEKGITMAELANRLNINPITLSQSLNGNPTLSRLNEVATALGVDIYELFEAPKVRDIHGCIYIDANPHIIKSKEDIEEILKELIAE